MGYTLRLDPVLSARLEEERAELSSHHGVDYSQTAFHARMAQFYLSSPPEARMNWRPSAGGTLATTASMRKHMSIDDIKTAVCQEFGVTMRELVGQSRASVIARARHVVMHLSREYTQLSYPDIGNALGGRDHSTVIAGRRRITAKLTHDETLRSAIARITLVLEIK